MNSVRYQFVLLKHTRLLFIFHKKMQYQLTQDCANKAIQWNKIILYIPVSICYFKLFRYFLYLYLTNYHFKYQMSQINLLHLHILFSIQNESKTLMSI